MIAQDPRSSDTIFAGTTLGLFKSPDGGKTWRHLTFEQVNWMVFDPVDPRILYLATEHAGIWKSADSGETFRPVNEGFANHRLSQITSDGRRLYASSAYEGEYGGIFVSDNDGAAWSLRANEEALAGRNLNSLTAAPGSSGALFAASEDAVLKSTDAGKTWSPLPAQPRPIARLRGQLRINALRAVKAEKVVLFAGTQNGLFRSGNSGTSWEPVKGAGVAGVPILAIYAPPRGASRLAVQTSNALFISPDLGKTWQPAFLPDSSYYLYDVALPLDAGAPLLAATSRGLLRSVDDGAHWARVTDGAPGGYGGLRPIPSHQPTGSFPGPVRQRLPVQRRRSFLDPLPQRGPGALFDSNAVVRTRSSRADFCSQRRPQRFGFRPVAACYCATE